MRGRIRKFNDSDSKVLEFIKQWWKENFLPPTLYDISAGCKISVSHAHYILRKLEEMGKISLQGQNGNKPVPIEIVETLSRESINKE